MIQRIVIPHANNYSLSIASHFANHNIEVAILDVEKWELPQLQQKLLTQLYDPAALRNIKLNEQTPALTVSPADWVIIAPEVFDLPAFEMEISRFSKYSPLISLAGFDAELQLTDIIPQQRARFLFVHFFYPVYKTGSVEIVPIPETDPQNLDRIRSLCEDTGKNVVTIKSGAGSVTNRMTFLAYALALKLGKEMNLPIETIDTFTGKLIGLTDKGVARKIDEPGIPYFKQSAKSLASRNVIGKDLIDFVLALPEMDLFYEDKNRVFDFRKSGFRPANKKKISALGKAFKLPDPEKIEFLLEGDLFFNRYYRKLFFTIFQSAAHLAEELEKLPSEIDFALREGAGWRYGPFEMWEMAGFQNQLNRMEAEGFPVPDSIRKMKSGNRQHFYVNEGGLISAYSFTRDAYEPAFDAKKFLYLKAFRNDKVWQNDAATIYDVGDGILNLEFHSYLNIIDESVAEGIQKAVELAEEYYAGLMIANEGKHFTVGANLGLVFLAAIEKNYERIHKLVRSFQELSLRIRYASVPVLISPHNYALGGGCEMSLHAHELLCSADVNIGLPEARAGLIPAGGGTKELTRKLQLSHADRKTVFNTFLNIATGKISASAFEAIDMKIIQDKNQINYNRARRLAEAKDKLINVIKTGFQKPTRVHIKVNGKGLYNELLEEIAKKREEGVFTAFETKTAGHIAYVMSGGDAPLGETRPESYFLDLEREAFVSLCGEKQTLERLMAILNGKKPPKN